ncbi:hypothetical protein J6590_084693 [Homalodisca vitripennis]|nr:hypothetical protein J6590_084693 [Homalodisca vitripennis]
METGTCLKYSLLDLLLSIHEERQVTGAERELARYRGERQGDRHMDRPVPLLTLSQKSKIHYYTLQLIDRSVSQLCPVD